MFDYIFEWPPASSTVIGIGILVGVLVFSVTAQPELGFAAAAVTKILIPQRSDSNEKKENKLQELEEVVEEVI